MEPEPIFGPIFTPDIDLEWELGPEVEILFIPEEE